MACDLVVKYEVLKAQNILEEKARREWAQKWGVLLEFDKIVFEEAHKRGISKQEYQRRTVMRKSKGPLEANIWEVLPAANVPQTTSAEVGWRGSKEYSLEKFGSLYISPKLTLPYEPPYSSIFLG